MSKTIRVVILEDHQAIIDGYLFRLSETPEIEVVATAPYGEDLEPLLGAHAVDVLLLDVDVPTSAENANPYPILHLMPQLLQSYPSLVVLVISMHAQRTLIKAAIDAGASGYILKEDRTSIRNLGAVIRSIARGGVYLSDKAQERLLKRTNGNDLLTPRQTEALSLLAAYPDLTTADLARQLDVAHSTARNLLSGAYVRLGVRNRTAAITKARQLGLITPLNHSAGA